jgi:hypothetical protein
MSGPDHYETAEELLQYASDEFAEDWQFAQLRIAAAQVHATLAQAAATIEVVKAIGATVGGTAFPSIEWNQAVSGS